MSALYVITAWALLSSLASLFVRAAKRGDTDDLPPCDGGEITPVAAVTSDDPLFHTSRYDDV